MDKIRQRLIEAKQFERNRRDILEMLMKRIVVRELAGEKTLQRLLVNPEASKVRLNRMVDRYLKHI